MAYIKKCPDCSGINLRLDKERGEVICRDCGLVIEERMIDFENRQQYHYADYVKQIIAYKKVNKV